MGSIGDVPVVAFTTISLRKLEEKDAAEMRRMWDTCARDGFFYLELGHVTQLLENWTEMLRVMKAYFAQDLEAKMHDCLKSDSAGYEPMATSTGAVQGLPDYYESFKIPEKTLVESSGHQQVVANNLPLFKSFMSLNRSAVMTILTSLNEVSRSLGQSTQDFMNHHEDLCRGRTTMSVFRYPKQEHTASGVGHNRHTDLGTLTFLLTQDWGLQVLHPSDGEWKYVEPRPNHAIINVGDTLNALSNRQLRSVIHRVMPREGRQMEDRYSIAYFLRAEDGAAFRDPYGVLTSAEEYHDKKFDVFRQSHLEQDRQLWLTGGMEPFRAQA